ncbi:MAG: hypothetical protein AB7P00_33230, partial [Sandaracinaceae bacterium]
MYLDFDEPVEAPVRALPSARLSLQVCRERLGVRARTVAEAGQDAEARRLARPLRSALDTMFRDLASLLGD